MRCQVEEAYGAFLQLMENPNEREQVLAQLMFAGLIDVQDRTVFRLSFTTAIAHGLGHDRAGGDRRLGERPRRPYAGVMDLGVGPHWYSMYEMACTYSRVVLQGQDVEMRHKNTKPLSRAEVKQTVDVIQQGHEVSVVRHIGGLLQAASRSSIIDAIQLAGDETLIECGSPAAYNMPMHAYEYVNTVRWFYDRFDHPHQAKLLFVARLVRQRGTRASRRSPATARDRSSRRAGPAAGRGARSWRSWTTR